MTEEYRSVEQRIWDTLKIKADNLRDHLEQPIAAFARGFIKSSYGTAAIPFRIPTFIRKFRNRQAYAQREYYLPTDLGHDEKWVVGTILGFFFGVCLDTYLLHKAYNEGNQTPATVLAATLALTNIASGIYEASRAPSRKENLENKTQNIPTTA